MRAGLLTLRQRLASAKCFVRRGFGRPGLVLLSHLTAFTIMLATERTVTAMTAFALAWGILNFFWLALTCRPVISGALSLLMMALLVLLSQLKYHVLMMTANFVDLMIVDTDTVSFLFMIFPALRWIVALGLVALVPLVAIAWRLDPLRVHRRFATALFIPSGLVRRRLVRPACCRLSRRRPIWVAVRARTFRRHGGLRFDNRPAVASRAGRDCCPVGFRVVAAA